MSNGRIGPVYQKDIANNVTEQDVSVDDGKTFHVVWIVRIPISIISGVFGFCIPSLLVEGGSFNTPEEALVFAIKVMAGVALFVAPMVTLA